MKRTKLRDFVYDLATDGFRTDLNPTTVGTMDITATHAFYIQYMRDMEARIIARAREVLDDHNSHHSILVRLGAKPLCEYCYRHPITRTADTFIKRKNKFITSEKLCRFCSIEFRKTR